MKKDLIYSVHFSYGIGTTFAFLLVFHFLGPVNMWTGMAFGLLVWIASYGGWIPLFKIMPPVWEQTSQRNFLLTTAHLIWGGCLGYVSGLLL